FVYKGVIYIEGDLSFSGHAWILGAVIARGAVHPIKVGGGGTILYSKDAINLALGKYASKILTLSYREKQGEPLTGPGAARGSGLAAEPPGTLVMGADRRAPPRWRGNSSYQMRSTIAPAVSLIFTPTAMSSRNGGNGVAG